MLLNLPLPLLQNGRFVQNLIIFGGVLPVGADKAQVEKIDDTAGDVMG